MAGRLQVGAGEVEHRVVGERVVGQGLGVAAGVLGNCVTAQVDQDLPRGHPAPQGGISGGEAEGRKQNAAWWFSGTLNFVAPPWGDRCG